MVRRSIEQLSLSSKARQKLRRTFLYLPADIETLYFDNFAVFTRAMQPELLTAEARERIGTIDPYREMNRYFENTDADSLLDRMLYTDTKTYLHELLMKQDQMSMAASVESRVPFLDHKLVEFTAQLPEQMKLRRGWTTKYILREAMKNVLPAPILKRSKMGFPVPVGKWFRNDFRNVIDEYVLGERAVARGIFARDYVSKLVAEHAAGVNHSERLWSLVNFEMWQRQFIDGEQEHEPQLEMREAVVAS
jgi:asparagine synthase (glutamine-hydrolysing)